MSHDVDSFEENRAVIILQNIPYLGLSDVSSCLESAYDLWEYHCVMLLKRLVSLFSVHHGGQHMMSVRFILVDADFGSDGGRQVSAP